MTHSFTDAAFRPGSRVLDEYEVLEEIAAGGMGTVFRVRQSVRNEDFALKVPHAALFRTADDRRTFVNEIQHWVRLPRHQHLVQCYFVRELNQQPIVFAEYVPGGTLADWIQDDRIESAEQALRFAIQMAEGLAVAQAAGLIHRDLKPSNCLMTDDGRLKVGDFGLAAAESMLAASGHVREFQGTPAYCSPEQMNGERLDVRTDMWAFGVTLLEMMTGLRPQVGPAARHLLLHLEESGQAETVPAPVMPLLYELLGKLDQRPLQFSILASRLAGLYQAVTGLAYESGRQDRSGPWKTEELDVNSILQSTSAADSTQRTNAIKLLRRALSRAGRSPDEAEQLAPDAVSGTAHQAGDLLAAKAILGEAIRLYEPLTGPGAGSDVLAEYFAALHLSAQASHTLGDTAAGIQMHGRIIERAAAVDGWMQQPILFTAWLQGRSNRAVMLRQSERASDALHDYDTAIRALSDAPARSKLLLSRAQPAMLIQNRAMTLLSLHEPQRARRNMDRAILLQQALVTKSNSKRHVRTLAGMLADRGVVRRQLGDASGAVRDYGRAIDLYGQGDPEDPVELSEFAMCFLNRASARLSLGKHQEALMDADEAVSRFDFLARSRRMDDQLFRLSQAYNNRGQIRLELRNFHGATDDGKRCIDLRQRVVRDQGKTQHAIDLGKAYLNQLIIYMKQNSLDRADQMGRESVAVLQPLSERRDTRDISLALAKALCLYATVRFMKGHTTEAADLFRRSSQRYQHLLQQPSEDVYHGTAELLLTATAVALERPQTELAAICSSLLDELNAAKSRVPLSGSVKKQLTQAMMLFASAPVLLKTEPFRQLAAKTAQAIGVGISTP
ncbi:MAG: serine/threonine-protein kinase [Planctomycetaceae bacterium]